LVFATTGTIVNPGPSTTRTNEASEAVRLVSEKSLISLVQWLTCMTDIRARTM